MDKITARKNPIKHNKNVSNESQVLISVCICTYKRPELLTRTLNGVISQVTDNKFLFEVVIVDNDIMRSAENVVIKYQQNNDLKIIYDCEPEQNIAMARNRAIQNASGNFIAFIDDDEFPVEKWLNNMRNCLKEYKADIVLGPVLPEFADGTPEWLIKSGLCNRPRNTTGSPVTGRDLRTGNILLRRNIFEEDHIWFNPSRGRTGGEDGEFLLRQIKRGRKLVWCDEAIVFEKVQEDRWDASFYLKRNFLIGVLTGKKLRQSLIYNRAIKSIILLFAYSFLFIFTILFGKHIWMKVLTKIYYNVGCTLSFLKLTQVRYRQ